MILDLRKISFLIPNLVIRSRCIFPNQICLYLQLLVVIIKQKNPTSNPQSDIQWQKQELFLIPEPSGLHRAYYGIINTCPFFPFRQTPMSPQALIFNLEVQRNIQELHKPQIILQGTLRLLIPALKYQILLKPVSQRKKGEPVNVSLLWALQQEGISPVTASR